jgi:hypothetical protein
LIADSAREGIGTPSLLRGRGELKRFAEPSVKIPIAERPFERRKGGFAGAVAWRDVVRFKRVVQGRHDFLYVGITHHNQVEPAGDEVDAWVA